LTPEQNGPIIPLFTSYYLSDDVNMGELRVLQFRFIFDINNNFSVSRYFPKNSKFGNIFLSFRKTRNQEYVNKMILEGTI
jgi:hypothetical protein